MALTVSVICLSCMAVYGSSVPSPRLRGASGNSFDKLDDAEQLGKLKCPGNLEVTGYGPVQLVPTGWGSLGFAPVDVSLSSQLSVHMTARGYFADACTAGQYNHSQYVGWKLLGKTLKYTTDLSGAGCGCNGALYLTAMKQNVEGGAAGDYYCDANGVGGVTCAEIDIQEANQFAWHTTEHSSSDPNGNPQGYGGGGDGWSGPRQWSSADYGPGAGSVDTNLPFQVAVSFPKDSQGQLSAVNVTLSQEHQDGHECKLTISLTGYAGNEELTRALQAGMTPIMSYWEATDMLWLDGQGKDGQGPCNIDADKCRDVVKFYGFAIE